MKEQIEFIRQKAIEANPDIKKLKFGCVVENKGKKYLIFREYMDGYFLATDGKHSELHVSKLNNQHTETEILGRDIRLADIIQALMLTKKWLGASLENQCRDYFNILIQYNLRQDRLEDQSPETIEFIYNLLK